MNQEMFDFLEKTEYCFEETLKEIPILEQLKGVPQNPVWHGEGDAFIHTKMVCEALILLPEWERLSKRDRGILYLSAFFHDIGKSRCTKSEMGTLISPNHGLIGTKMFHEYCYLNAEFHPGIDFKARQEIGYLIRFHGLPPLFMEKTPIEYHVLRAAECVRLSFLYLLAKADLTGRKCSDKSEMLLSVDYFKEYACETGCFAGKFQFKNQLTRFKYFRGRNVWAGDELYEEKLFFVYLMSGLPLSGKDVFIRTHLKGLPVISLDAIREEWKIKPGEDSGKVAAEARSRAKVLLRRKESFVWNATDVTREVRLKLCRMFEQYGAQVVICYLEVPYGELLRRNGLRERKVPEEIIRRLAKKMDRPDPVEAYRVEYYAQ